MKYGSLKYRCDGNCGRTIGSIGVWLWIHSDSNNYCPDCASKIGLKYAL